MQPVFDKFGREYVPGCKFVYADNGGSQSLYEFSHTSPTGALRGKNVHHVDPYGPVEDRHIVYMTESFSTLKFPRNGVIIEDSILNIVPNPRHRP